METKYCIYCKKDQPYFSGEPRNSKTSGFYGAQCWSCFLKWRRERNRKLVPCPVTGDMVPYSMAHSRKLVPCPVTGDMVPYSTAYQRKLVPCPVTGNIVSRGAAKQRRMAADSVANGVPSYKAAYIRKYREDPRNHLVDNIRSLILQALYNRGYGKDTKTAEILGCSFEELRDHLEEQFVDGMTWDNMGTAWHIDHRLPVSAGATKLDVIRLNHHSNLQPLWGSDNQSKGNKHDPEEVAAYLALFDEPLTVPTEPPQSQN